MKTSHTFRFEAEDVESWKSQAETDGVTLSEWIRRKCNGELLRQVQAAPDTAAGMREVRETVSGSSPSSNRGVIGKQSSAAKGETQGRPQHDVKTCRVYGCGMCKAAKESK